MGATTIVQVMPVWARLAETEALTGCPENVLRRLVNDGKVRARKMSEAATSACVFRLSDVLEWLEEEAVAPGPFKVAADKASQA